MINIKNIRLHVNFYETLFSALSFAIQTALAQSSEPVCHLSTPLALLFRFEVSTIQNHAFYYVEINHLRPKENRVHKSEIIKEE